MLVGDVFSNEKKTLTNKTDCLPEGDVFSNEKKTPTNKTDCLPFRRNPCA